MTTCARGHGARGCSCSGGIPRVLHAGRRRGLDRRPVRPPLPVAAPLSSTRCGSTSRSASSTRRSRRLRAFDGRRMGRPRRCAGGPRAVQRRRRLVHERGAADPPGRIVPPERVRARPPSPTSSAATSARKPPAPDDEFDILPDEVIEFFEDLGDDLLGGSFGIDWPGSDVQMTLTRRRAARSTPAAPSRPACITATARRRRSSASPTRRPDAGRSASAAATCAGPASTSASTSTVRSARTRTTRPASRLRRPPRTRSAPRRRARSTRTARWSTTCPPGWSSAGPDVTHRFAEAGDYRVTLIVKDDDGGLGFGNAATHFVLEPYAFSGFKSPVEDRPTVNKANAGQRDPGQVQPRRRRGHRRSSTWAIRRPSGSTARAAPTSTRSPRRPRRGPAR